MTARPSRTDFYAKLVKKIDKTLSIKDGTASLANTSAAIYWALHQTWGADAANWVGFYMVKQPIYSSNEQSNEQVLVLGPFHGQPAVPLIASGRGVCGTCLVEKVTQLVPDVHLHPNHIACDSRSQSEIVVPVFDQSNCMIALIDIDSPVVNGFDKEDQIGLEAIAALLQKHVDWDSIHPTIKLDAPVDPDDVTCPSGGH